jgi:hypothetical protein
VGLHPHYGYVEVECRATLTERSMFSAWMVGLEVEPDDCGEICLVEVFGDTLADGAPRLRCRLGAGPHRFPP